MHTLTRNPITLDCFEIDDFVNIPYSYDEQRKELKHPIDEDFVQMGIIPYLESLRKLYLRLVSEGNTKGAKRVWKELIRWLPESWLQTRTVTFNYENLIAMCSHREFHKLNEWSGVDDDSLEHFIKMVKTLPYANEFIFINKENPLVDFLLK